MSEGRIGIVAVGSRKIGVIEKIKELSPELYILAFGNAEVLGDRKVDILNTVLP